LIDGASLKLGDTLDGSRVQRVLIYRLGSFGDTIVLLPCLHHLARVFPHAERRMLTNVPVHGKAPAASAVLGNSGLVHSYLRYVVGERNPWKLLQIIRAVRRFKPDLLVYLAKPRGPSATARDQKFFRLCGIRKIIGLPIGDLAVNLPLGNGMWEHEAARLARTIAPLGPIDIYQDKAFDLCLSGSEISEAEQVLQPLQRRPLIACGPGTKMQAKDWGTEKWRGLLDGLAAVFPNHGLVLIGAQDDRKLNLCGRLSPRLSAAVIARTELFMGPDSGPMHVASAVGVPCAIPFASRTMPGMWFPIGEQHRVVFHQLACSNCNLETCVVKQRLCLSTISVEEMVEAAVAAHTAGQASAARSRELS
jgi:heptosyltransferase-3